MVSVYTPLRHCTLPSSFTLRRTEPTSPRRVTPDSPAIEVMTDLYKTPPLTIMPNASIEAANRKMIDRGVRLLFVTNDEYQVLGIITATDILGEKPMKHLQRVGGTREDILVQDIMTPRETLQALDFVDVAKARVGDIVATLKEVGRQHTLVVDRERDAGNPVVRGLFSSTRIGRQLGTRIVVGDVAKTFVALERVLAS
jgi:CBS-domain-containing membrane protein